MSQRVDEKRLAEIEARNRALDGGPWRRAEMGTGNAVQRWNKHSENTDGWEQIGWYDLANKTAVFRRDEADFIANARQDVTDLVTDLRAERERADQLERLLGYIRRPAEVALAKVPPVRDAKMPGYNVTVTWHTGDFILRELVAALTRVQPAQQGSAETPEAKAEAALKLAIRAFTVDIGGPNPAALVPNGPAEAAWCRLADYLLALPGEPGRRVAALVCDYLEANIERLQALRVAAEAFFRENFQEAT